MTIYPLLLAVVLITGCATEPRFYFPPNSAPSPRISRIVLLPPQVEIVRMSYRSHTTLLTNETCEVDKRLSALLLTNFANTSLELVPLPPELNTLWDKTNSLTDHNNYLAEWFGFTGMPTTKMALTNTLSGTNLLSKWIADKTSADALLFIQLRGRVPTASRNFREWTIGSTTMIFGLAGAPAREPGVALGMLTGFGVSWGFTGGGKLNMQYGFLWDDAEMRVVLVQGQTGKVLAQNYFDGGFRDKKLNALATLAEKYVAAYCHQRATVAWSGHQLIGEPPPVKNCPPEVSQNIHDTSE
jgi:hypothetical protein